MRIALIGYGKMGQAIEKIALERGHEISCIVNRENPIENVDFSTTDVAIEFTKPELATKVGNYLTWKFDGTFKNDPDNIWYEGPKK